MNKQKWLILLVALALMGGTAWALTWLRAGQKLGKPGVRGTPIPGSVAMKLELPERVLDFTSTNVPEPSIAIGYFPNDTSYVERLYTSPEGLQVQTTVILMGADRTSIHRPEYCLNGQGFNAYEKSFVNIPIGGANPYPLEIAKWKVSREVEEPGGTKLKMGGVYVFWFVADNEETASHDKMLEWLTLDLFRKGALQRWAYISYFAECIPGNEDATYERMKQLIEATVPEFEIGPKRI